MSWHEYAACRGENPELFFPIGTSAPAVRQLKQAKAICASCAVQSVCLEWAMLAGIDHGVWGGLSEAERRTLKRRTVRNSGRAPTRSLR